jgi:hypothetical protein
MDDDKDEDKRRAGQIGGAKRAEVLPPERRAEIARLGALRRWSEKPIRALHKGNFQEKFGIDVDCYVLDDVNKTAVISQRGMASALGFSMRGNALPRFLSSKAVAEIAGAGLIEKFENPLKFQWGGGGAEQPPGTIHGFDATLLIDLANAIIAAEAGGALSSKRYENIVKQAHIIVGASARLGIRDLVYALAGYSPTVDEIISAFKHYVQEEARKYEPEFPPELYGEWYRLYEIPELARGKPWHFKYLTVNHIYYPLAQSRGKIFTLLKAHKAKGGDRAKKLFQFLNEIGARALGRHLGRVLEMAESSATKWEYEAKIAKRFGFAQQLELPMPMPVIQKEKAAN